MKFKMNNDEWKIKEISNMEMNTLENNDEETSFIHGTTRYSSNTIYINESTPNKRKTLIHELTHCFMYEFGHNQFDEKNTNCEDVCEISSASHDIIHKIVEDYFKGIEK